MFTGTIILAVLLAAGFLMAGLAKLTGAPRLEEARQHLDIAPPLFKAVGALEALGAAGVLLGLLPDLPVIGVLAAVGLVAMTIGATSYHQKAGDSIKDWLPAVAMGSLAIFYIILRIGTA